jgi:hypothetical protein
MRGKSVLNTIRKLRIDAYIQYARNAKFLLRFGSIPHLRMYRTLRTEHEMYADFSAKYPKLDELYNLFVQYNIVKQRDTEIMESIIREETERIRKQLEVEAEMKMRTMETQMKSKLETYAKQLDETYSSSNVWLKHQRDTLRSELETVREEKDRFKSYYTHYMDENLTGRSAESARLNKIIDDLLVNIQMQESKLGALREHNVSQQRQMDRQSENVEELIKTIAELKSKIDELYCTNIVSQGINFASDFVKNTYAYLVEIGTKAEQEVKTARKERITKKMMEEEAEKIRVEAERIREEMERERERLAREQREREEQEQKEREEREQEQEQREREQKEREQKEQEQQNSPVGKLKIQRDKIIEKMKELNKLRIAEEKNCNALKDDLDTDLPSCKSKESLNRVRKLFVKNHPDKNPNCVDFATKKSQVLSDLKDYINDLNNC